MPESQGYTTDEIESYQQQALQSLAEIKVYDEHYPPFGALRNIAAAADRANHPELTLQVLEATEWNKVDRLNILKQLHNTGDPHAHGFAMGIIDTLYAEQRASEDRMVVTDHFFLQQGETRKALEVVCDPEYMQTMEFWGVSIKHLAHEVAITHANGESAELLDEIEATVATYSEWLAGQPDDNPTIYVEKLSIGAFDVGMYRTINAYVLNPSAENHDAALTCPQDIQQEAHNAIMLRSAMEIGELPDFQVERMRTAVSDPEAALPRSDVLRDLLGICLYARRFDLIHEFFIENAQVAQRHIVDKKVYDQLLDDAIARRDVERMSSILKPLPGALSDQMRSARAAMAGVAYDGDHEMVDVLGRQLRKLSANMVPRWHYQRRYGGHEHAINEGLVDIAWGDFSAALKRAERPKRRREVLFAHLLPYIIERHGDPQDHLALVDRKITTPDLYRHTYETIASIIPEDQLDSLKNHVQWNIADETKQSIASIALAQRLALEHVRAGEWHQALETAKLIHDDRGRAQTLLQFVMATEASRSM